MKHKLQSIAIITLSMSLGVVLYVTTRTDALYLNKFFSYFGSSSIRNFILSVFPDADIPGLLVYSLPDALWMLALTTLILTIWDYRINSRSIPLLVTALLAGILFETGQGLGLIKGTFDGMDMIGILIGFSIPVFYCLLKLRLCVTN